MKEHFNKIQPKLRATAPTPKQIAEVISREEVVFDHNTIDRYRPTEFDIEQKQEVVKRKKRDK